MALCTICDATQGVSLLKEKGAIIKLRCGHFIMVKGAIEEQDDNGQITYPDYSVAYHNICDLLVNERV